MLASASQLFKHQINELRSLFLGGVTTCTYNRLVHFVKKHIKMIHLMTFVTYFKPWIARKNQIIDLRPLSLAVSLTKIMIESILVVLET